MRCDRAGIIIFEQKDYTNGTSFIPNCTSLPMTKVYEQEEQKELSLLELQELLKDLADRVARLELHHAQF